MRGGRHKTPRYRFDEAYYRRFYAYPRLRASDRREFAVLGDTVNVAARIEEMTKTAGFPFVVSQDLLEAAGPDAGDGSWSPLPAKRLRGRHRPVKLFGSGPGA